MKVMSFPFAKHLGVLAIGTVLAACSDSNNTVPAPAPQPEPPPPPVTQEFTVSLVNLTAGQPFSPLAAVAHRTGYSLFTVGEPATEGLEQLAEGGETADLLAEADANDSAVASLAASDPLPPGATETLTFTLEEGDTAGLLISAVTMLVNTNDAITAARNVSVEGFEVDQSVTLNLISYDAGTEANTEASGTMPGPADGGEGFNAARDNIANEVRGHSGVVTADDGLSGSVLTQQHRWDNPVARITITRTQ